jgi:hypothetical protein
MRFVSDSLVHDCRHAVRAIRQGEQNDGRRNEQRDEGTCKVHSVTFVASSDAAPRAAQFQRAGMLCQNWY